MRIRVKVNAGAQSDSVKRLDRDFYQVRTRAPAVEGKANRRVVELLAAHFGCDVERVTIVAGHTSPIKHVDVSVAGTG